MTGLLGEEEEEEEGGGGEQVHRITSCCLHNALLLPCPATWLATRYSITDFSAVAAAASFFLFSF